MPMSSTARQKFMKSTKVGKEKENKKETGEGEYEKGETKKKKK